MVGEFWTIPNHLYIFFPSIFNRNPIKINCNKKYQPEVWLQKYPVPRITKFIIKNQKSRATKLILKIVGGTLQHLQIRNLQENCRSKS